MQMRSTTKKLSNSGILASVGHDSENDVKDSWCLLKSQSSTGIPLQGILQSKIDSKLQILCRLDFAINLS